MRRKFRKQRVVLRPRQRVAVHKRLQYTALAALMAGLAVVCGRMIAQDAAMVPAFLQRYNPVLEVRAPETLADIPLLKQRTAASAWLWLPGAEWRLRRKWLERYPSVGHVHFEKNYQARRVLVRLEPRIPLVQWQGRGIDKSGAIFALAAERWPTLPKANLPSSAALPALGPWLAEVSRVPQMWNSVVGITQDYRGEMWLAMQTGTQVAWGSPDLSGAQEKARGLAVVLDDAHQRLRGAASADLRFFGEGRVIVRPKSAT